MGKPAFWAVLVGVLFCAPFLRAMRAAHAPPPPPVLGGFPAFTLVDDRGIGVASGDLRGRAFLVNLLCLGCVEEGALAAEAMRTLQHRSRNLGEALHLISFSPDGDAASLSAVRRRRPASERWALLVGAPEQVRALFTRGTALLLVDGQLRIRGRYAGSSQESLDAALRDAARVIDSN